MADAAREVRRADPDRDLVHRARGGDYEAFEQLVGRYERPVYALAMRILQNRADAEEAVQETFLAVVEHLAGFKEEATFQTWLLRIATNKSLKILKKRKRRAAVSLDAGDDGEPDLPHPKVIAEWRQTPDELAERQEVRELLADALRALDEKYRLVFILRDVEGMSTEETAKALGISQANVKVRLLRARLMLREQMTERFGDPDRRMTPDHSHHEH